MACLRCSKSDPYRDNLKVEDAAIENKKFSIFDAIVIPFVAFCFVCYVNHKLDSYNDSNKSGIILVQYNISSNMGTVPINCFVETENTYNDMALRGTQNIVPIKNRYNAKEIKEAAATLGWYEEERGKCHHFDVKGQ